VRLAAAEQDIIEDLLANLEDLRPREKIELLKHIKSAIPEREASSGSKKLTPEEAEKRIKALATGHLKAVK
jgi:hypothetical protein